MQSVAYFLKKNLLWSSDPFRMNRGITMNVIACEVDFSSL